MSLGNPTFAQSAQCGFLCCSRRRTADMLFAAIRMQWKGHPAARHVHFSVRSPLPGICQDRSGLFYFSRSTGRCKR